MSRRYRILIAIEKNELRFWSLAQRVLARLCVRSMPAAGRLAGWIGTALLWAHDAVRTRREEIRYLTGAAENAAAAERAEPRAATTPSAGVNGALDTSPASYVGSHDA